MMTPLIEPMGTLDYLSLNWTNKNIEHIVEIVRLLVIKYTYCGAKWYLFLHFVHTLSQL